MSAKLAASVLAAVNKDPTSVTFVEQVTVSTTPFDTDTSDGSSVVANAKLAPVTSDQVTGTDVLASDEVLLVPGANVPAFLDGDTKVEVDGIRYNITRVKKYGTAAALVGAELIIRR